jgi:hypothetical protein
LGPAPTPRSAGDAEFVPGAVPGTWRPSGSTPAPALIIERLASNCSGAPCGSTPAPALVTERPASPTSGQVPTSHCQACRNNPEGSTCPLQPTAWTGLASTRAAASAAAVITLPYIRRDILSLLSGPRIGTAPPWLRRPRTRRSPKNKDLSLAERKDLPPFREGILPKDPHRRNPRLCLVPPKNDTCQPRVRRHRRTHPRRGPWDLTPVGVDSRSFLGNRAAPLQLPGSSLRIDARSFLGDRAPWVSRSGPSPHEPLPGVPEQPGRIDLSAPTHRMDRTGQHESGGECRRRDRSSIHSSRHPRPPPWTADRRGAAMAPSPADATSSQEQGSQSGRKEGSPTLSGRNSSQRSAQTESTPPPGAAEERYLSTFRDISPECIQLTGKT